MKGLVNRIVLSRIVLSLLLAACVPSTADADPAGGADVTLMPSAATRGTPFTTGDGWTVTIHKVAIRASASSITTPPGGTYSDGGGPGPFGVLAPIPECHLRISGAAAGDTAAIGMMFAQIQPNDIAETPLPACGVDAATEKRFGEPSEQASLPYAFPGLPSLLVQADAVKADRHITVSMAVATGVFSAPEDEAFITVVANEGIPVRIPFAVEAIFLPSDPKGVAFDEVAAADANGDGTVTGLELATTVRPCALSTDDETPDAGSGDDDSGLGSFGDGSDFGSVPPPSPSACPTVLDDLLGKTNPFGKGMVETH